MNTQLEYKESIANNKPVEHIHVEATYVAIVRFHASPRAAGVNVKKIYFTITTNLTVVNNKGYSIYYFCMFGARRLLWLVSVYCAAVCMFSLSQLPDAGAGEEICQRLNVPIVISLLHARKRSMLMLSHIYKHACTLYTCVLHGLTMASSMRLSPIKSKSFSRSAHADAESLE